jgi:hypothetical protein
LSLITGLYYFAGSTAATIKFARIIIIQDTGSNPLTSCETQIEIGSQSAVTAITIPTGATASNQTNPKYWYYDSAKWDGTLAFYFEAVAGTPTSKSAATVQLQVADGTGDGFTGWSNVTNGTLTTTSAGPQVRTRAASPFTPISGRWYRIVSSSPTSKSAMNVYGARIIVQQTSATAITKLQPQYLLSNTLLAAGTGLQNFLTTFDPAEWSGVTNSYSAAANAANGSTSVVTIQKSDGSATYATVSSPDNGKIQAFTSVPSTSTTLDVKAATNNNDLYAVRILVDVVVAAAAAIQRAWAVING